MLFKLQACTQLKLNKEACTSKLCEWKKSRTRAHPSPLDKINFRRPKKDDTLPQVGVPFAGTLSGFVRADPVKFATESQKNLLKSLKEITPNAAVLTCVSLQLDDESSACQDDEDTDTASETEENTIPELLTSFFDPCSINYSEQEIIELGEKSYESYKKNTSKNQYNNLTEITCKQSLSNRWMLYRAGRITSSNCKKAFTLDLSNPAVSTINSIMQYSENPSTKAIKYGKDSEPKAFAQYLRIMKEGHSNFTVKNTGLHVNYQFQYIGASPDGLTNCDCCGKGVLEIKCPFNYQKGLSAYKTDKNCPIVNNKMKEDHEYYYQVQLQMLVTETKHCDFFIWSQSKASECSTIMIRVEKNESFCLSLKNKIERVFKHIILPELVTRKRDPNNTNYQKFYCYCNRPCIKPMIGCDNVNCKIGWFHYACVNVLRTPQEYKQWFCPDCRKK